MILTVNGRLDPFIPFTSKDYSGDAVARSLRISGRGVSDCRERGKKIFDKENIGCPLLQKEGDEK